MRGRKKTAGTYAGYLRLSRLLRQQVRLTSAHDELQFIIVHQVVELWFKLLLFELEATREAMRERELPQACRYLGRIHRIVRTLSSGFDVIETMRPYDFLEFREKLKPASGFQSVQFREIEYLSGLKDERYLNLFRGADRRRLEKRLREPSVWEVYLDLLRANGPATGSERRVVESVIRILRDPDGHPLGALTEALIEYDELFSLWRGRHMQMTMRMIGRRPGTGRKSVERLVRSGYDQMGQAGVDYLRTTLSRLFFPLLWEARTFVRR